MRRTRGRKGFGWLRALGRRAAARGRPGGALAAPTSRALLPDLALVAVVVAGIWGGIGMQLGRERDDILERAERTAANTAGAAEQVISRTIEAIDQRLLFIREAYRHDQPSFSLDFLREGSSLHDSAALQVTIVGSTGRLLMANLERANIGVDLSDRPHFQSHLDERRDELFISVPLQTRTSGRWAVQFTRRLVAADGSFAGVAVVSLDPRWLTQLYETLDVGRGVMVLAGLDGIVRARAPQPEESLGQNLRGTPIFEASLRAERGSVRAASPLNGAERLVSYRRLPDYPLVLMVGRDTADILEGFGTLRLRLLGAGAGMTLLTLLGGGLMIRHKRQRIESQRALSDAIENISQGLIMVDRHGRLPVLNRRVARLLGLPAALVASRPDFEAIKRWQIESGEFGPAGTLPDQVLDPIPDTPAAAQRTLENTPSVYERVRPDGTVLEIRTQLLTDGGAVRTYTDVTERRRSEERIRFLAHHDALTGLANRFALRERLGQALALARRGETGVAVLALDLDRFKAVNDALGHAAGDALLVQVAARLRACARASDTVARIGGDEFIIVQAGRQPEAAEALAGRLVAALAEPFALDGQEVRTGTTVGIALPTAECDTAEELMRDADTALYRAKSAARGTIRLFEPEMGARRRARRRMEQDLRRILEGPGARAGGRAGAEELALHFQPIFGRRTRRVVACEALARWNHPERGPIPPTEFIAVAEESGLILPLGAWVLRTAAAAAAAWPGEQRVAVNVSPAQFRDDGLNAMVAETLRASGLAPDRLELEITEGVLIRDTAGALAVIRALKAQGVRLTLDDFGTGYSSLAYLHRFPFDRVKVDRSFVAAVEEDGGARAIVGAILGMASGLGLGVTAEGVETPAQLDFLDRHGCDELQGFLLARPMPAAELTAYLSRDPAHAGPAMQPAA